MLALSSDLATQFVPLTVVLASLAGSLHCAGMCGPLVAASTSKPTAIGLYHFGRLMGYLAWGAAAGWIGERLFISSANFWIHWIATFALGSTFLYLGIQAWRGKGLHLPLPLPARSLFSRLFQRRWGGEKGRATMLGLLSALLPCGWLHAFVLAAVATGSPYQGSALLLLFWVGTLPALTLAPWAFTKILTPFSKKAPRLASVLLILAGITTIGIKIAPAHFAHSEAAHPESRSEQPKSHTPSCH